MDRKSAIGFGKQTGIYCFLILAAVTSGFIYSVRTTGLFACQAPDPGTDQYIGTCNVTRFGDYDHGAFWFDLESAAISASMQATVLFVGNSRMQFGLSTSTLDDWFTSRALRYYLLGFSHHENYLFFTPLLRKMRPAAKMYVLNIDNFFDGRLTGPANSVMNEPESLNRYKQKFYWQKVHQLLCGAIDSICGNELSFVRKRSNGAWIFEGGEFFDRTDLGDRTIRYDESVDLARLTRYEKRAGVFLRQLMSDPDCVVLTNIPNSDTSIGLARSLAERLKLPLVAPEIAGLTTFDGSHLDPQSAERWSGAFIAEVAPHIERCLQGRTR